MIEATSPDTLPIYEIPRQALRTMWQRLKLLSFIIRQSLQWLFSNRRKGERHKQLLGPTEHWLSPSKRILPLSITRGMMCYKWVLFPSFYCNAALNITRASSNLICKIPLLCFGYLCCSCDAINSLFEKTGHVRSW